MSKSRTPETKTITFKRHPIFGSSTRFDVVLHPMFDGNPPRRVREWMYVTAKFARAWRRSRGARERAAERYREKVERYKIEGQLTSKLKALDGWEAEVAGIASDLRSTPEAIMHAFQKYDARVAAGDLMFPPFGAEDTFEQEYFDGKTGSTYTKSRAIPLEDAERVQILVEHVLMFCDPPKRRPQVKPKRYRRTKEAMRKARARAEGRVQGRPRKGPPDLEARIAATEKSLATRRAKLAELKSDPRWFYTAIAGVRSCEIGIERQEKALATYKARLVAAQSAQLKSPEKDP